MIHLAMLALAISLAWIWQGWLGRSFRADLPWRDRWTRALQALVLPPLLMLMTLVAILCMGPSGEMVGRQSGWLSFVVASGVLLGAVLLAAIQFWRGWRSLRDLQNCPWGWIGQQPVRILESPTLFAAQVGFWEPQLVVSRGLLTRLDPEHLEAVVIHEQAHYHYRDTFVFFWLGWLRTLAIGLPQTRRLWQELVVLRELRADRWAAQRIDPLVLAEALVQVATPEILEERQDWQTHSDPAWMVGMVWGTSELPTEVDRLEERIQALLDPSPLEEVTSPLQIMPWMSLALLPLLTIPLHGG